MVTSKSPKAQDYQVPFILQESYYIHPNLEMAQNFTCHPLIVDSELSYIPFHKLNSIQFKRNLKAVQDTNGDLLRLCHKVTKKKGNKKIVTEASIAL